MILSNKPKSQAGGSTTKKALPFATSAAATLLLAILTGSASSDWARVAAEWGDINQNQKDWFIQQHNKRGFLCCSSADGHPVDWEIRSSKYWVFWNDEWKEVPDEAVIEIPNPVGRAVLWVSYDNGIRCFIPGPAA